MTNPLKSNPEPAAGTRLRRRDFIGAGLAGVAGVALPAELGAQTTAPAASAGALPGKPAVTISQPLETRYWDRTDSFEEKLRLLEEAWRRKDFRLARALAHSLRNTAIQAQVEEEAPGAPILGADQFASVESLPASWRAWAAGWKYCKVLTLEEPSGLDRGREPVDLLLGFKADQATSLARELRVAQLRGGVLREIPSQVFHEVRRGEQRFCRVLFLAESRAGERQTFLIFYGNPDAELPGYPSDLTTSGEGFGLDIENQFYKATLARQMGQLERLTLKREHGLELFSGGEGHGEPPGIDWAHDYVASGNFQKLRISLWDACPDFEVVRGPLCTIVRRWGFPYSPVHPVFSPSRLNIDIEYRFYAGLPWFHKLGTMQAVKDLDIEALRDDEWVFSGHSFTDRVWMGADGKLRMGEVEPAHQDNLWGAGFFNAQSQDAFIALFLEHRAEGLPALRHSGAPTLSYRWHGQLWSRAPLSAQHLPAGATLHEKNAYVVLPFIPEESPGRIESLRRQLSAPLLPRAGTLPPAASASAPAGRLARPGEAGDSPISKRAIWDALRDCKDAQLYTADINVVDLGLVYDVRVRGDVVQLVMAMPHRGRPRLGYFTQGSISVHPTFSRPVRERLMQVPGVRTVVVEQTWEPGWSSNQLTDLGRTKLGL